MQKELNWTNFKSFLSSRNLSCQYFDDGNSYYLYALDGYLSVFCLIPKDSPANTDQSDFETNFKSTGNKSFTDNDNILVVRNKIAIKGSSYRLIPAEVTTAKYNGLFSQDYAGNNRTFITHKIYDSNGNEITDSQNEGNAVKSIIDFEPTYDLEIIGGECNQKTTPTTDIRIWAIAVPDVAAQYGGSKEMVGGINLKYIDATSKISIDGKASKFMAYNATYHTNKIRFIIKYDQGVQHDLMIILHYFA